MDSFCSGAYRAKLLDGGNGYMAEDSAIDEERIRVAAQSVPAIRFKQWLEAWDKYSSGNDGHWRKPEPFIYSFCMKAGDLRSLSDVYRRKYEGDQSEGVQRAKDRNRTTRIQRYVQTGYPFGDLPAPMRAKAENFGLRKPGWLPTAIVINILGENERRRGKVIKKEHLVTVDSK